MYVYFIWFLVERVGSRLTVTSFSIFSCLCTRGISHSHWDSLRGIETPGIHLLIWDWMKLFLWRFPGMDLWWPQAKFSFDALNLCPEHPIHYRGTCLLHVLMKEMFVLNYWVVSSWVPSEIVWWNSQVSSLSLLPVSCQTEML